ncbi:hypothetical protein KHA80_06235 [Anaerobacillus sp. HL2]|nr:hypothetical protein KHA80_06235 [Anaerobacillus sp. HL2]
MKKSKEKEIVIESISYVHDPDAAKEWFNVYLEIVKKALINEVAKQNQKD